ncbi:regulation of nuclear pre-mRNA domain-containing protein 1A isoform X2 [Fukomys damarensis]|uniref:regulation of nuclear pre-mRNA domain-containing protein 1A isoform X2 n=1 Tax=Fukomys damarensis TaxID=885580 RepID=UPI0008FF233D|nr:regulation of nuclear pre-mRNA domain-containing protein 1A isoform X2 [Fukomys damarensis]
MSAFSEAALEKKLSELSNSQQSVQTLSLWLIHHRKHSRPIVTVWERELRKAKPNRKLTFLYLANDVIQNSKRKGPEFTKDFAPVIVEAFKHVSSETDDSCKKHLGRVLSIWEERSVYENDVLDQLKQALYGDKKPRKRTYEQIKADENENCSSLGSPSEPPQTLDLVRALQDLENAASGDAAVHQRIASLPVEVQEVSLLDKITDKESGERLSKMVEDACMLLADYNGRLAAEIDDRKQLTRMLADFLRCQKEALADKEHKLEILDMGVSSNDVITISIFFLLKINIKLKSLYCLMFLKIEKKIETYYSTVSCFLSFASGHLSLVSKTEFSFEM